MLKPIGTIKVDTTGKVLIPKFVRRALDLEIGDEVDMYIDNGKLVIQKYTNACVLCGNTENTIEYRGNLICTECIKVINTMLEES